MGRLAGRGGATSTIRRAEVVKLREAMAREVLRASLQGPSIVSCWEGWCLRIDGEVPLGRCEVSQSGAGYITTAFSGARRGR